MDEYITDLQIALNYLKNCRILALVSPNKTLFLMVDGKIQVIGTSSRYTLSIEEFLDLYQDCRFTVLEKQTTDLEAALEKDAEYYSWKHK